MTSDRKIEPNVMAFLEGAAQAYGRIQEEDFSQHLYTRCLERHQSPIEDLFWIALATIAAAERIAVNPTPEFLPGTDPYYPHGIYCWPQAKIGRFTVDFLLSTQHPKSGVVVELDGHQFHDKNKHQRSYEKARDRFLVREGYQVLHFTGSDIVRDPYQAAHEVMELMGFIHVEYDPICPLGENYAE
jgi:very-short-patch-repair endonuclease